MAIFYSKLLVYQRVLWWPHPAGEDIEIHMVHFPAEESLRAAAQIRSLGVSACFISAKKQVLVAFRFSPHIGEFDYLFLISLKCSIVFSSSF